MLAGPFEEKAMVKYRSHSIAFKRQVAEEYLAGETLHGLAKTHDVTRNLIRIWVAKYEAGEFEEDVVAADRLQEYEAKIAALERMVGRLTMELDFLRGVSRSRRSARGGSMSIVTGPMASPSREDASS
jgi:transposase